MRNNGKCYTTNSIVLLFSGLFVVVSKVHRSAVELLLLLGPRPTMLTMTRPLSTGGWIGIEKKPYIISCHYENENICGRRFEDIRTRSWLVEWNPWVIWSQPPIVISYCQMTAFVFAQWLNAFENSNASIVDRDSSIRSHFAVVLFNEPILMIATDPRDRPHHIG